MRHPLSFLGGFLAGMAVMFYLDERSGDRRRARLRSRLTSAEHDLAERARSGSQHAFERAKEMAATHRAGGLPEEGASDQELHDRVRERLAHTLAHPEAVQVEVQEGSVRLRGHVLRGELDSVLGEVRAMAGVRELRNALQVHDQPDTIPGGQAGSGPASPAGTPWH